MLNYRSMKFSGERMIYKGVALLPLLSVLGSSAEATVCVTCGPGLRKIEIVSEYGGDGAKIAGDGAGPAKSIQVNIKPQTEYTFHLTTTVQNSFSHGGTVKFGCGLQCTAQYNSNYSHFNLNKTNVGQLPFFATGTGTNLTPSTFTLRLDEGENSNGGNQAGSNSGPTLLATPPSFQADPNDPGELVLADIGAQFEIDLGSLGLGLNGTAPYRSAGLLAWYGNLSQSKASPTNLEYLGVEEVKGRAASGPNPAIPAIVTYTEVIVSPGGPKEMHLVTPSRLFRVTGFSGTNANNTIDYNSPLATSTYVREYVRASSAEALSTTLAPSNVPLSWWKVLPSTNVTNGAIGIQVEKSIEGKQITTKSESIGTNVLITTNGDEVVQTMVSDSGSYYIETVKSWKGGVATSMTETEYELIAGEVKIIRESRHADPAGDPDPLVTEYGYYHDDDPINNPLPYGTSAGQLRWVTRPDGSWEAYRYSSMGTEVFSPFSSETYLDTGVSDQGLLPIGGGGRYERSVGGNVYVSDDPYGYGGLLVKSGFSAGSFQSPATNNVGDGVFPDDAPLTRYTSGTSQSISYASDIESSSPNRWLAGEPVLSFNEQGKAQFYEYEKSGSTVIKTVTSGVANYESGGKEVDGSIYFHEVPNLSDKVVCTYGTKGLISTEYFYHTGSGFTSAYQEVIDYDTLGRYLSTSRNGVVVDSVTRPTPLQEVHTDAEGRRTTTTYSADGEVVSTVIAEGGGVPAQTVTEEVSGLTTTTRRNGVITDIEIVDGLGRLVSSEDATGAVTTYSYDEGGRIRTTESPGEITRVEETYLDGRVKSLRGNGIINEFYTYDVYEDSNFEVIAATTHSSGSGLAHSARQTTSEFSVEGSLLKVTAPSPEPTGGVIESVYNYVDPYENLLSVVTRKVGSSNDLSRQFMAASENAFSGNAYLFGAESVQGLDLSADDQLGFGSADRFVTSDWSYVLVGGEVYRQSRSHQYPNGLDNATRLTTISRRSLSFIPASGGGGYAEVSELTEPSGRKVTTTREVYPATATIVSTEDDSSTKETGGTPIIDSVSTTINGYLQSVERAGTAKSETYGYDAFGRVSRYTDIRQASTWSFFYNGAFQLEKVRDHLGRVTSYDYYLPEDANAGRTKSITHPGGAVTLMYYNERGQTTETAGTANYRQIAGYDNFGVQTTLETFGSQPALTRWIYDPATGVLTGKRFNDATAGMGKGFDYEYTADGRLAKRTSARGVVTNYTYDPVTRDLTNIAYSGVDSGLTPNIVFSQYDHFGRAGKAVETLGSAVNEQTFGYQPHSGAVTTQYGGTHQWLPGVKVEQVSDDAFGRPSGFKTLVGTVEQSRQSYQYDTLTRLGSVSSADLSASLGYIPGTSTLDSQTISSGGQVIHERTQAIDLLGRTVGVRNSAPTTGPGNPLTTVASIGHGYDAAGRRKNAIRDDGTRWDYSYNSRSEVQSALKKTPGGNLIPGLSQAYTYDGIGNRLSSTSGSGPGLTTRAYIPDALNQYDGITNNGRLAVLSRSDATVTATATAPGTTVIINGMVQEGNFHSAHLTVANGATGKLVTTTLARAGVAQPPVKTWVPPSSVVPTYDLDGNLKTDGRWTYMWDGENRLVSMVPLGTALSAGVPNIELIFAYDWMGRRIGKSTVDKTSGSPVATDLSSAYDQWNPVAEWSRVVSGGSSTLTLRRTHLWGLDMHSRGKSEAGMAPDFQSAGGVGGLVASTFLNGGVGGTKDHFIPSYDANGNIVAWTGGNGALLQRMDYDPFGNMILAEKLALPAVTAKLPGFGFSTKLSDVESGLYYYGHRYYDPSVGRWPSRDSIGESGGANVYGFVANEPVSSLDYIGNKIMTMEGPKYREAVIEALQKYTEAKLAWEEDPKETASPKGLERSMWYKLCVKGAGKNEWWDDLKGGFRHENIKIYLTEKNSKGEKVDNNASSRTSGNSRRVTVSLDVLVMAPKAVMTSDASGAFVATNVHPDGAPVWKKQPERFGETLWHELVAHAIVGGDISAGRKIRNGEHRKNPKNSYIVFQAGRKGGKEVIRVNRAMSGADEVLDYMNDFNRRFGYSIRRPQYWDYWDDNNNEAFSIEGDLPEDIPANFKK